MNKDQIARLKIAFESGNSVDINSVCIDIAKEIKMSSITEKLEAKAEQILQSTLLCNEINKG